LMMSVCFNFLLDTIQWRELHVLRICITVGEALCMAPHPALLALKESNQGHF
jgi:hypothetical protein